MVQYATGILLALKIIAVRVDRKPSGMALKVKIPKGTTALVTLPSSISTVNGKRVSNPSFTVGAGTHMVIGYSPEEHQDKR